MRKMMSSMKSDSSSNDGAAMYFPLQDAAADLLRRPL